MDTALQHVNCGSSRQILESILISDSSEVALRLLPVGIE